MTEDREFYASTVDEAVSKAAADLGSSADELVFEVLDEGSAGFLGMGARDARIAVRVEGGTRSGGPGKDSLEADAAVAGRGSEGVEVLPTENSAESFSSVGSVGAAPDYASGEEPVEVPEGLLKEIGDRVSEVLAAMDFRAGLEVYDTGGYIAVDVTPENTALFIGQKGETIDALQYLINVAVYKERPFVKRIVLDAEGYRQRRVEALQGMAHRTARRAVRERRAVELPPMNSSERRVVHLFLQENPGVTTQSEGTGDNRRVRVSPV